MSKLPLLLPVEEIRSRLEVIFPEGIDNRNYVIRDMAARTVYVMLYAGAIEGQDRRIRPSQVCTMTNKQAHTFRTRDRDKWYADSLKPGYKSDGIRWYADNTRESIRDETIRHGFIPLGAVVELTGLNTTSPKPRFFMAADFAQLFDPALTGADLESRIEIWRKDHLKHEILSRIHLIRSKLVKSDDHITVAFPNGEGRVMSAGTSSQLCKAVVEDFAPRFLIKPAVLWLSESGNKVVERDDKLASALKLHLDASKNLPDIILVDLGKEKTDFLIVFVEAVATDGPIHAIRKENLKQIATEGDFDEMSFTFLTAFTDRQSSAYRRHGPNVAWGSYIWFMSEPDNIVVLKEGCETKLIALGERPK